MEITLEKIELVKDRTGVSYKEAKEALEFANGNVVDAIIYVEENIDHEFSSREKKAVNKVVLKGTKKTAVKKAAAAKNSTVSVNAGGKTISVNGKEISYSRVLTGTGTAYTARRGARTSTGKAVKVGLVAVDPGKIPYGTKLYIVSADGRYTYGYAIAADTGGALRSGRVLVDLFYNTERECINFGRRQVKVYILD